DTVVVLSNWEYRLRPLLLTVIGVVIAWQAQRRSRPTLAVFGLILGWTQLCRWLTGSDGPLTPYRFAYRDVDAVMLVLIAFVTSWLVSMRQLTNERMLRLLAVTVLLGALNQTDFLDNPFSPLFGFAGVAFLAFAVVWNILTAGNGFANNHTPGLPRESRLLMYLGYVLLTVSVSHWYFVSHNIGQQDTQNTINTFGFLTVGLPLAYLAIVELGEPLLRSDDDEPAPIQAAV
ncbi:MAG TPA: hypothetical protein VFT99_23910, partial [Roseiflexaceae bacterium]|nr:hypothetical protein [Roseiflexaceae bacterium]